MRPEGSAAPATDAAAALLGRFVQRGVRHIVLSPGSRSQSLALVAAELEQRGLVQLHVRIDERVAGFTGLGVGREEAFPAIIICTSGTAAANLLPPVLEAHHAGVPLVVLTADRPPELRGVGANQTTRQPGMYGSGTRYAEDLPVPCDTDDDGASEQTLMLTAVADAAVDAALGAGNRSPGPVHLNVPYREPLSGAFPEWLPDRPSDVVDVHETPEVEDDEELSGALYQGGGGIGEADQPTDVEDLPFLIELGLRTLVVAGADAGPEAAFVAERGDFPLVAEIVSGARFGRRVIHGYREALADEALGGAVERVVVFGHPTLTREIVALLSREEVEVIVVRGAGEPVNLNGAAVVVDAVAPGPGESDRAWLADWMRFSNQHVVDVSPPAPDADAFASAVPEDRLGAISAELKAVRQEVDRELLVDAVWRATWPHDRLVFASSRLVRVADRILPGKRVAVHANRGLAGIDGTVATATGIAIASQAGGAPGVTRAIVGDLAFLHDVGALLLPPNEDETRLQVVVGNDGGGSIFDLLEVAGTADSSAFDRVMYTPQAVRIEHLARAYGWEYQRVTTRLALDQALLSPAGGRQIIEVALVRETTEDDRIER